jgi:very-short-patch-repair endonuclease
MHIYSTRRLRDGGLTTRQIARHVAGGRLARLRRGVYAEPGADPVVIAAVRTGGRLTCVSALALTGAWTMPSADVHVRVATGVSVTRGPGQRLHWTHERLDDVRWIDDPLTALALAVECLDLRAAVVVIDSVVNRRILDAEVVVRLLIATPRGRRLLKLHDGKAESGIETLARLALRSRNLRVRTQVPIAGIGRVDLLIGDRLVLEVDGREWHADFERDRARDRALAALGYLVIRASYRQVMNDWPLVEAQILKLVRRREHLWRRTLPQGRRHPRSADAGPLG